MVSKDMFLIVCFFMGIGNFAMHKAVAESGHPFVEDTKIYFGQHFGQNISYFLEFAMLLGAMIMAHQGVLWIAFIYFAYTFFNGVAAWLLLSGRV
jgi:hypothetical protein